MACKITKTDPFVEIHASGSVSHWDLLKTVHQLHRNDPLKKMPDLWVLDPELDFSMHSFPVIVQGILRLASQIAGRGCKSAILAADEFQRAKIDMYCAETSVLPYDVRGFTARNAALAWLKGGSQDSTSSLL